MDDPRRPRRIRQARPRPRPHAELSFVHPMLRRAADYSWRLLVVALAVYLVLKVLGRFQMIAIAVFLGLVVTSMLRPLVDLLARWLPRWLAVVLALLAAVFLVAGLLGITAYAVASEASSLSQQFRGGLNQIEKFLQGPPFKISAHSISNLRDRITTYVSVHRSALIRTAVSGAGRAVEGLAIAALALFCSVFFMHSGDRMWRWFTVQLPTQTSHGWDRGGRAAWRTFSGYIRGIVIVAASNAAMVGIALLILRVPLVLPLVLLEFFAAFIPLVGAPVAMAVAAVVALASRGLVTALIVLALIVVIGQIEGHVLHPVVMSWAVRLHPVVVAVSVLAGTIAAGVIGALVAVPIVSVVWAVIAELRRPA